MTLENCTERWLTQIERMIHFIENELLILNADQLNYRLHIRRCSILEIMNHLYLINSMLILKFNQGSVLANENKEKQEYMPGRIAGYVLSQTTFSRCIPAKGNRSLPSGNMVFSGLLEQQNKLKDFISVIQRLDMNKRIVPFRLFGLIKLSLAETLEYIMLVEKSHFTLARHLLKLQL